MALNDLLAEIFGPLTGWLLPAGVVLSLISIKKLELAPWRWLANWCKRKAEALGKYLTAAVMKELAGVKTELGNLSSRLDAHIITADRNWAEGERQHILDFSTGLTNGTRYDHEAFRQVLASVDKYEDYCKAHPDYPNSMAVAAIDHVRQAYHDFLIHKEDT